MCTLHSLRHNVREICTWSMWTCCNTVIASMRSTFQIDHQILAVSDAVYRTVHGGRTHCDEITVQLADLKYLTDSVNLLFCSGRWETVTSQSGPLAASQWPPGLTNGRHSSASTRILATARATAMSYTCAWIPHTCSITFCNEYKTLQTCSGNISHSIAFNSSGSCLPILQDCQLSSLLYCQGRVQILARCWASSQTQNLEPFKSHLSMLLALACFLSPCPYNVCVLHSYFHYCLLHKDAPFAQGVQQCHLNSTTLVKKLACPMRGGTNILSILPFCNVLR